MNPLLLLIPLHLIFTFLCLVFYLHTIEIGKRKLWMFIVTLLPIVNVMVAIISLDITATTNKDRVKPLDMSIERLKDDIIGWENKYKDLEKSKFRKIRVGDRFMIPNSATFVEPVRGKMGTIIEIDGDGIRHKVEGVKDIYKSNWSLLKQMIFLSNEPIPFDYK